MGCPTASAIENDEYADSERLDEWQEEMSIEVWGLSSAFLSLRSSR